MKWLAGQPGSQTPLGVTICNEAYRSRAEIAARQFVKHTGCPAAIVEEQDFPEVRRLARRHIPRGVPESDLPYVTKFFLFDLIDAEQLVYFDADHLFLRPWNPTDLFDDGRLRAVRDFWWNPGVVQDCHRGGIDVDRYFATGLMLLHRHRHLDWLRESARLFRSFDAVLIEQAALNTAAQRLNVPVGFLPREYCLIDGSMTVELGTYANVGVHLMSGYPAERYEHIIEVYENRGIPCLEPAATGLVGEWLYDRVAIGTRTLEFRPDGTLGNGSAGCERFWRVWEDRGDRVLAVFGQAGNESWMTTTFTARPAGHCWRGRWRRFEQNEVLLYPQAAGAGQEGCRDGPRRYTTLPRSNSQVSWDAVTCRSRCFLNLNDAGR